MGGFGRAGDSSVSDGKKTFSKNAVVSDIKASPEKGKKRIIAREKSARGQSFAMDIPMREARDIERKRAYTFDVYDKPSKSYGGGGREKKIGYRAYNCDDAPCDYTGGDHQQFKSFSNTGRLAGGGRGAKGKGRLSFQSV